MDADPRDRLVFSWFVRNATNGCVNWIYMTILNLLTRFSQKLAPSRAEPHRLTFGELLY